MGEIGVTPWISAIKWICYPFNTQVRSSNGQTIVRVEGPAQGDNRSNSVDFASHETIAVRNSPVYPETDSIGLPLADCEKPAPWSTPPQKTYKQVNCFSLLLSYRYNIFL